MEKLDEIVESVRATASAEAMLSALPGYYDGPADAARHIIGVAELRRRAGITAAWTIATFHEVRGRAFRRQSGEVTAMDLANNSIGLAIGGRARTYADVVAMTRDAIAQGVANGGTGMNATPVWLPQTRWQEPDGRMSMSTDGPIEWGSREPGGGTYAFGGFEHSYMGRLARLRLTPQQRETRLLADLAQVPPAFWSEDDVRAVIRSRPYSDSRDRMREVWHERVREYFRVRQPREDGPVHENSMPPPQRQQEGRSTGPVHVAAYTRRGEGGAVHVSAHLRSPPGPG
jgi:hypothetical protein